MRLNDHQQQADQGATEVGKLKVVMVLAQRQDKTDKASTVGAKRDKAVMLEQVLKLREAHKGVCLVLEVTEHRLAIEQEEQGEEKIPAGSAPPRDAIVACDGKAEAQNLMKHANLHEDDSEEDEDVAGADDGDKGKG